MDNSILLIFVVFLVTLSALCSGLNLSLMAINLSDLKRKAKTGNQNAIKVLPLRLSTHLSLASILLTNVAVISATSLVLEHRFNGLIAGVMSTLLIVVFGEIFPQAMFMRNALKTTAFFSPLLKAMIIITYPVSKPLQLLLDKLLGEQETELHSRHELGMLIAEHDGHEQSELDENEVDIIQGALALSEKRVASITTPLKRTYWFTPHTILNAKRIDEIKAESWSRIPVFDAKLTICYGLLLMKDLIDIDFDEREYRVSELPLKKTKTVGSKTALDTLFRIFIAAHTHLLPVEQGGKIVGIVTIEDLLEEILGHEIEDESDVD